MCDPLEAQSHIDDYFNLVPDANVNEYRNGKGCFKVQLLESSEKGNVTPTLRWRSGVRESTDSPLPTIEIGDLQMRPPSAIRIIFTGIDDPNRYNLQGLRDIFEAFSIPSVFLKERVRGVTNSFGTRDTNHNTQDSWLHFLCKNILLVTTPTGTRDICGPSYEDHLAAGGPPWIQGAFFMKWNKSGGNIFLCCFGAFPKIEERLRRFVENADNVHTALYDPYTLYVIILDELHIQMDAAVWDLISVFNTAERAMFEFAAAQLQRKSSGYDVDFSRLHNLEKLVIHLKEGCDAIIETAKSIQKAHGDLFKASHFGDLAPHPAIPATEKDLEYMLTSFQSLRLRITSVETRVKNVITLGFNLVIQRDSTLLQEDSQSMKTIAIMTLVFLPGTAVASIFGTQFFNTDFSGGVGKLKLTGDFWILWALILGTTITTMIAWWFWLRNSTAKRYAGSQLLEGRAAVHSLIHSSMA